MTHTALPGRRTLVTAAMGVSTLMAAAMVGGMGTASAAHSRLIYTVHPHMVQYNHSTTMAELPKPSDCLASIGIACYTPALIRKAYNIPADWTGAGQSIAIVDAYGSPTVREDLAIFSQQFGLPKAKLNIYCPEGCPKTLTAHHGGPLGWAGETSLDVQWAHAIAPDATINLIVAPSAYGEPLNNAVRYAVKHQLGDVLSMSYGATEAAQRGNNLQIRQAHKIYQKAVNTGMSLFASAGDDGATDGSTTYSAGYPSSDPLITAVGGTNLYTTDDGTYQRETVWGDQADCPFTCAIAPVGATGGAPSLLFKAPAYQQGITNSPMRTTADVSYNASVYTSVFVYNGFNKNPEDNGWYFYGGTSSGSPQWAAIGALADAYAGHRLGQLNPRLYGLYGTPAYSSAFHDVTSGNNAWNGPGFDAGTGYDMPTGLGSPDVAHLIPAITRK